MLQPLERIMAIVARRAEMALLSRGGVSLLSIRRLRMEVVVGVAPTAGRGF